MIYIRSERVPSATPRFAFPAINIAAAKCQDVLRDKVRIYTPPKLYHCISQSSK